MGKRPKKKKIFAIFDQKECAAIGIIRKPQLRSLKIMVWFARKCTPIRAKLKIFFCFIHFPFIIIKIINLKPFRMALNFGHFFLIGNEFFQCHFCCLLAWWSFPSVKQTHTHTHTGLQPNRTQTSVNNFFFEWKKIGSCFIR